MRAQGRCAAEIARLHERAPLTGKLGDDGARLLPHWGPLLRAMADHGPQALADEARTRAAEDGQLQLKRLHALWDGGEAEYVSRALLRPYLEALWNLSIKPDRPHPPGRCEFCGGAPWIAVRRPAAEGDGAARFLGCALCGREQPFPRVRCPSCNEAEPAKLPSYSSEEYANARIEACETCKRYVKSIDLSLDARPVPEVDDLLSIGMDLWAVEQGFERIEPGLAGL